MKKSSTIEIWIGVVSLLPSGDAFALAWVRRRDEWLADASTAARGSEIAELGRMYLAAVSKRGTPPDALNLCAAAHADALHQEIGDQVLIDVGFDSRARALSDAAASAIDITFGAEALVRESEQAYDPARAPDPTAWLAMPKDERQQLVRLAHMGAGDEMRGQHLQLHAGMHDAVETQLARNDPPETAATLQRLQGDGLGRHDAIHAIAAVLMRAMHDVLTTGGGFDTQAYTRALRALNPSAQP